MAFEQLKELGERASARMQHLRHSSPRSRDADDPFGHPQVVEVELFEEVPVVHRQVFARERVAVDVHETAEQRLVEAERRVEHIETSREGER